MVLLRRHDGVEDVNRALRVSWNISLIVQRTESSLNNRRQSSYPSSWTLNELSYFITIDPKKESVKIAWPMDGGRDDSGRLFARLIGVTPISVVA
jgi:hypothetical protein